MLISGCNFVTLNLIVIVERFDSVQGALSIEEAFCYYVDALSAPRHNIML